MKKIDRLRQVERAFGPQFVAEYRHCTDWPEISDAIGHFESKGEGWGLRTDSPNGADQRISSEFLFNGTREKARDVWERNGRKLYYLVSERIPEVLGQGAAMLYGHEHVLIELNSKEAHISQRDMYNNPGNLRHFAIGPGNCLPVHKTYIRSYSPGQFRDYSLDVVYEVMVCRRIAEATFTIKPGKKLIIW